MHVCEVGSALHTCMIHVFNHALAVCQFKIMVTVHAAVLSFFDVWQETSQKL